MTIGITRDCDAAELRKLARREHDGKVTSRLLAIAAVLEGANRTVAARQAGMDRQTLRALRLRSGGCTASTHRGWLACPMRPRVGPSGD